MRREVRFREAADGVAPSRETGTLMRRELDDVVGVE